MSSAASTAIEITRPEYAELIRFARSMYSGSGIYSGESEIRLIEGPEPGHEQFALCAVLKDIMRKSLWRFIVNSGGFLKTEVLVGEEPVHARIWDRFVAPDNPLTVTKTSLEILAGLYNWCRSDNASMLPKKIKEWSVTHWGDALLLHVAILALLRQDGEKPGKKQILKLISRSPLTSITHYAYAEPFEGGIDFITAGDNHLYFWYVIDHIVDCWLRTEEEKPGLSPGRLVKILERQTGLFEKLFELFAPPAERGKKCDATPHLLEVVMRFYGRLLDRAGGLDGVLAAVEQTTKKLGSNREKEDIRRLWSGVFEPGRRLDELNLEIAKRAARLDATPSEQFFSKRYHAYAGEYGKEISALVSALRGEIGTLSGKEQ